MFRFLTRWIDWKFMAATACLILVVMVGWTSVNATDQRNRLVAEAEADRVRSSQERQELIRGQQVLREDYKALLAYLESAGITVPPAVLRGDRITTPTDRNSGPRITIRSGGSGDSESGTKSGTTPNPQTNAP